jgi:signal transduction histidine kinase
MLRGFFASLFARRFALEITLLMALVIIGVNEYTYRTTTTVLRGGIALTDERIAGAQLLQALTDAETSQRGFLLTQDATFLAPYQAAILQIPKLRTTVVPFLDIHSPASSREINDIIDSRLNEMATTIALAQRGSYQLALEKVKAGVGRDSMGKLQQLIDTELTSAANRQSQARISIYDALAVNHAAVIFLTLSSVLLLYVFTRQVRTNEAERAATEVRLANTIAERTLELRQLAQYLQTVREDEKDHLARELHDELGALLTVAKLDLEGLRKRLGTMDDLLARVERISARINQVIVIKRRMVEDMRPSSLSLLGLRPALEQLCLDMANAMDVPFHTSFADVSLGPESDLVIFRFFQEALTNVAKYAQAKQVWVELHKNQDRLELTIRDDGVGFDTAQALAGHHGLTGMRYRIDSLGGSMTLVSKPREGTCISANISAVMGAVVGAVIRRAPG